jgi:hypothetical protein
LQYEIKKGNKKMDKARETALKILYKIDEENAYSNIDGDKISEYFVDLDLTFTIDENRKNS